MVRVLLPANYHTNFVLGFIGVGLGVANSREKLMEARTRVRRALVCANEVLKDNDEWKLSLHEAVTALIRAEEFLTEAAEEYDEQEEDFDGSQLG